MVYVINIHIAGSRGGFDSEFGDPLSLDVFFSNNIM